MFNWSPSREINVRIFEINNELFTVRYEEPYQFTKLVTLKIYETFEGITNSCLISFKMFNLTA